MASNAQDGQRLNAAAPVWFALVFALVGVGFLAYVYGSSFRPRVNNGLFQAFDDLEDDDLYVAVPLVVIVFSGAGASLLMYGARWRSNHQWSKSLQGIYAETPWKWRPEWEQRRIEQERPYGLSYIIIWACLCLMAAAPGLEQFWNRGGWPAGLPDYAAIAAATIGLLTLMLCIRGRLKRMASSNATLHMASETGVIGGPLEAAIQSSAFSPDKEYLVRLVCERHWISERRDSDGDKTTSHEVTSEYDDAYRAFAENGLIPVRFAIPFNEWPTTETWLTPVRLWFVELEDTIGNKLARFWVPVFKTDDSSPAFTLGNAFADRSIREESPAQTLQRYGVGVSEDVGETVINIPPGRSGASSWIIAIMAIVFLGVAAVMLPKLWNWKAGFGAIFEVITGLIFGGVFGLFGVVFFVLAMQMLFERRRVTIGENDLTVRRSYFGLGWLQSLRWDEIKQVQTVSAGSQSGQRQTYRGVVAMTEGVKRPSGRTRDRRWSICPSLPDEAAEALKTLLEAHTPENA